MTSSVVAQKALIGGVEVADNATCTLPTIEFGTSELKGAGILGTLSISSPMQLGELTTSFTARRFNDEMPQILKGSRVEGEYRFVEDTTATDGRIIPEGTKIFYTGYLTKLEMGKVESGSPRESSAEFNLLRYREIIEGVEKICIDKLANVFRVDGKNILADYQNRL